MSNNTGQTTKKFYNMSNNKRQTTSVNTHLVNFCQPYQFEPSNIPMDKIKTENLSKQFMKSYETNTNLGSNKFSLTQSMKKYEAGINTNLPSNRFPQTQPKQHYEAGVNTNLGCNRFSQTQPIQNYEAGENTN